MPKIVKENSDLSSPIVKGLLGMLLKLNPQERISAREALGHRYFSK